MSSVQERTVHRTIYPHVVKIEGVCGGQAIIEGHRIAVWHIVGYYYQAGLSVEDILRDFPQLTPAQVFAALAYYHDNQAEIDRARYENSHEYWKEHYERPESAAAVS